jgi:hypothetical protein
MEKGTKVIDGVEIVNTTPHDIAFQNGAGEVVVIEKNLEFLVNAKPVETPAGSKGGAEFVKVLFVADAAGEAKVAELEALFPNATLVGSIIAAQAFPGRVAAMTPAAGFERVAPAEKRMNPKKFTTF